MVYRYLFNNILPANQSITPTPDFKPTSNLHTYTQFVY